MAAAEVHISWLQATKVHADVESYKVPIKGNPLAIPTCLYNLKCV